MLSSTTKNDLYPLLKITFPLAFAGVAGSSVSFFETIFLAHLSQNILAAGALASWLFGVFLAPLQKFPLPILK